MNDELARLESALCATSPRPPAAARERAISEALAAFDRHHQGSNGEMRHKGRVPMRGTSWIRRLAMPLPRPLLAFAGSAAVVVVAGILSHQVLMTPPTPPVPVTPVAPTTSAQRMDAGPERGGSTPAPQPAQVEPPVAATPPAPPQPSWLAHDGPPPSVPVEAAAPAPGVRGFERARRIR